MWGYIIFFLFGEEKDFKSAMEKNPGKTLVKTAIFALLVLIIILAVAISMAWAEVWLGPSSRGTADFSTTSSIYMRDYPADQNIINLDNVGTLRPFRTFDSKEPDQEVTLALNFPITVLNEEMAPVSNGSAYFYKNEPEAKDLFYFNTISSKSHQVEVAGRTFLVTLMNIRDISSEEKGKNYIYHFGVREH